LTTNQEPTQKNTGTSPAKPYKAHAPIKSTGPMANSYQHLQNGNEIYLGPVNALGNPYGKGQCKNRIKKWLYTGQYSNGLRSGLGTQIFGDGREYSGSFHSNEYSGQGTLKIPNQLCNYTTNVSGFSTYKGNFENSGFHGLGQFEGPIFKYTGNWVRGKRTGKGKFIGANGDTYEGNI
jgi:hypothetical protein